MKVLIAGSTGALGVPLVRALIANGHQVLGITRTPGKASLLTSLGAQPIVVDVMDRENLLRAVDGQRADAVVHALTALPKNGPLRHSAMYPTDALRDVGTTHLLAAAREVGARKMVVESHIIGYGFGNWGDSILTEEQPFAPPGRSRELERHLAALRSMEQQIFEETRAGWIEGVSLRYGSFYGPESTAPLIGLLRRRALPLPAGGQTFMSWIYIEDAATAMVAALERGRAGQAYNIVDDEPVRWHDFMTELARAGGAPAPWSIPRWVLRPFAPFAEVIMAETSLRVSNAKARSELDWAPGVPTYREGIKRIVQALDGAAPREGTHASTRAPWWVLTMLVLTENVACELNAAIEYDKEQGRCARDRASREKSRKYYADLQPVPGAALFYCLSYAGQRHGCRGYCAGSLFALAAGQ